MGQLVTRKGKRTQRPLCSFLNEHELAEIMGMSVSSVRRWRLLRKGPKYLKVGGVAVRYKSSSLQAVRKRTKLNDASSPHTPGK
jgi:predicted DNA-binding transcriptional regulator AlpA